MKHSKMSYFGSTSLIIIYLLVFNSFVFAEPYEGYTLFNPNNSRMTYLIDMDGETIHSWNNARGGGYSVYLMENGNLMRPAQVQNAFLRGAAYSGLIQEIDWDGNVVWEFEYNSNTYIAHHDIEVMPNGNVLLIAWEVKSSAEAVNAGRRSNGEVWPDHIVEVEPQGDGGNIVWEWHVWDHLVQDYDANRENYGVVADHPELIDVNLGQTAGPGPGGDGDWLHINGISYNPENDQIVISSHYVDEFFVIDHSTTTEEAAGHTGGNQGKGGDILYRWGCPSNYDAPGDQVFDVIHCSNWVAAGLPGAGNIMAFNNGERNRNSSIVEIVPPLDDLGNYVIEPANAYGPEQPVWSYSNGRDFYSNHLGSCQRLPNGNTLISESTSGYLFEVDTEGNLVWDFDFNSEIARSLRYGFDYPGLDTLRADDYDFTGLVINEFMVLNQTTVEDENGEYDSWIEFYNNTDNDFDLTGVLLTDNIEQPDLWTFPQVIIPANDYLVIWADNDLNQEGYHTSLELNAGGGAILIIDPDLDLIDEIEYGVQSVDISLGRYPNGIGDFIQMSPSFENENFNGIIDNINQSKEELPREFSLMQNYPNPFNPTTTIAFSLPENSDVTLSIYNILSQKVAVPVNTALEAGYHAIFWEGKSDQDIDLTAGVYFYILQAGEFQETRKMILVK